MLNIETSITITDTVLGEKVCHINDTFNLPTEIIYRKVLEWLLFKTLSKRYFSNQSYLSLLVIDSFAEKIKMTILYRRLENSELQNILNGLRNYANFR